MKKPRATNFPESVKTSVPAGTEERIKRLLRTPAGHNRSEVHREALLRGLRQLETTYHDHLI